jgi:deoxyribonuclease-1
MLTVKTMLALGLVFLALDSFAALSYYPQSTLEKFQDQNLSRENLKNEIFNLSAKIHIKNKDKSDTLSDTCPKDSECVSQKSDYTYKEARQIMFGELFLQDLGNGHYQLKEVYCNNTLDESKGVGPHLIPNQKYVNCEHTWPQSKFSKQFPTELQKTDLHHLFPVDMKANSTRNNNPFGEVNGRPTHDQCLDSQIGESLDDSHVRSFEPPKEHKGNVARAIYYFSTRYKIDIDEREAKYLKLWNEEDPVDEAELERNDKIMQLQGNRNPFIDYPALINRL